MPGFAVFEEDIVNVRLSLLVPLSGAGMVGIDDENDQVT